MLPKSERLTRDNFRKLKPKVTFRGVYFDVAAVGAARSRFACVIAKKRIRKAVDRNKVKRRIYSILQDTKPKTPHIVIVYPKPNALHAGYPHMKEEIQSAFDTLQ